MKERTEMPVKKLTLEEEARILLRRYFGHEPEKELAAEFGITVNEVKKLVAEDHGIRRREQRCLEETGSTVLMSPISRYLYTVFAKAAPQYFQIEKLHS